MSLEEAIFEEWGTHDDLTALLPVEKCVAGDWQDDKDGRDEPTFPYATLNIEGTVNDSYTSSGRYDSSLVRIQVWGEDRAQTKAIAQKLVDVFDNQHFARQGERVYAIRKENVIPLQEDDGVWQYLVQFQVMHKPDEGAIDPFADSSGVLSVFGDGDSVLEVFGE